MVYRKKCPPDVFCINNTYISLILLIIIGTLSYLLYINRSIISSSLNMNTNMDRDTEENIDNTSLFFIPTTMSTITHEPKPYHTNMMIPDNSYLQCGILTPTNSTQSKTILPLMGKMNEPRRSKWNYYTTTGDQTASIKLPVIQNKRTCTSEYGCNELYTGDTVYIEGYNEIYKVTIYDNNTQRQFR